MSRALFGPTVWPTLTKAVARSKGRVYVASGYVGQGGLKQLPLSRGSVLVCDCSESAVKSGATNPSAVREFVNAGVEVWQAQGLHAKVFVLPKRAFVGSANVSMNSSRLIEAVLETTDTDQVRQLREFVQSLCHIRVTRKMLSELEKIKPVRDVSQARSLLEYPVEVKRLIVVDLESGEWSNSMWRAKDKGDRSARAQARQNFTGYEITVFGWSTGDLDEFRLGDLVLQVSDEVPWPPASVVHVETHRGQSVVWVATPKSAVHRKEYADVLGRRRLKRGGLRILRGADARRIVDLHRPVPG